MTGVSPHVSSDDRAIRERADLQKVAELVGAPEPSRFGESRLRAFAIGERPVVAAGVAHFASELGDVPPDANRPLSSAVNQAVGGDLVDGCDQVRRPRYAQS